MMGRELNYKIIKTCIMLSVLIFLVPYVIAGEESLFSGTVNDGQIIDVDGKSLSVSIEGENILVDYNNIPFILGNLECDTSNFIKVCISGTQGSFSADVSVYIITTEIEVKKEVKSSKENILAGEIFTVKLNITNTGNRIIDYLKIEEDLSDFFIINVEGCSLNGNIINLETSINPRSVIKCDYRLQALNQGSFKLDTKIEFFDGYKNQTKEIQSKIKVIDYGLSLNNSLIEKYILGEKTEEKFSLINNYPYDIKVSAFQIMPKGFIVTDSTLSSGRNREMLRWTGEINGNSSLNFTLNIQIINITNEMDFVVYYTVGTEAKTSRFIIKFFTGYIPPEISIKSDKNDSVVLTIRNPNDKIVLNRPNILITSESFNLNHAENFNFIKENEIKDITIKIPEVQNSEYSLFVNGSFYTEYGELISFISEKKITPLTTTIAETQTEENYTINETNQSKDNVSFVINIFRSREKLIIFIIIIIITILLLAGGTALIIHNKHEK